VLLLLNEEDASISAVLNFRKALAFTQKRYPRLRLDQRIHEAASNHHKQCTAD
jgi:hypothetical protein